MLFVLYCGCRNDRGFGRFVFAINIQIQIIFIANPYNVSFSDFQTHFTCLDADLLLV